MTVPHLDDDQLSAHLDGEAGPEVAAHVGSCPHCEARLGRLEAVSSQLRAPVPLPAHDVREAAVAAAREAWQSRIQAPQDGGGADVVSLEQRRRVPRWAMPVAAAAAALLLAVPVLSTLRDGDDRAETASTADRGNQEGSGETAGTDGGDLGEQSDPTTLGLAIRGALPGAASEQALAAPSPEPAADNAGATGESQPSAPAPRVAARAMSGTAGGASGAPSRPFVDPPCTATARASYGRGLGPLVYAARLRWQGEPAVVLAYRLAEAGAPGLDYRVLVLATNGCGLLMFQSL